MAVLVYAIYVCKYIHSQYAVSFKTILHPSFPTSGVKDYELKFVFKT